MNELTAIDLCCGAGGWACAGRGLPIRFVAVADRAQDCVETWRVNHAADHPGCSMLLCDLATRDGPESVVRAAGGHVDLVLGGIPCEEISCHRGALPVGEERMQAWYELVDRILALVEQFCPRWWAVEDVIQIERHLPLPLWHGREIPTRRIDAAAFGPQSRVRTFLGTFPEPIPVEGPRALGECLLSGPHLTFPRAETYEVNPTNRSRVYDRYVRILDPAEPCPTITASFNTRGGRQKRTWVVEDQRARRRMLSWQEAALVQGFPRDFLFASGNSRAAAMIGQAIPIHVGRAILRAIIEEAQGGDHGNGHPAATSKTAQAAER